MTLRTRDGCSHCKSCNGSRVQLWLPNRRNKIANVRICGGNGGGGVESRTLASTEAPAQQIAAATVASSKLAA